MSFVSENLEPEQVCFEVQVRLSDGGHTPLHVAPASDYAALWSAYQQLTAELAAHEGGTGE